MKWRILMNKFMTELDVISQYPKELSDEMVVLMRRVTYLQLMMNGTTESHYEGLDDVREFPDFIYNLFNTKKIDPMEFVRRYHQYELQKYIEGEEE
jgi:hypothetical protein